MRKVIKCVICGEEPKRFKRAKKYCSYKCRDIAFSKSMLGNTRGFKKGHTTWNHGKNWPEMQKENHPNWKGDKATYGVIHKWIYRNFGKATKCEHCKATSDEKRICWANVSHDYKRERSDWIQLCYKCHWHYDKD